MLFVVLAMVAMLSAGCSGINTSQSVSPASFFLPGLMKADPPKDNPAVLPAETPKQFALVR